MSYVVIATSKSPGTGMRRFVAATALDAIEAALDLHKQGLAVTIIDKEGKAVATLNEYVNPDPTLMQEAWWISKPSADKKRSTLIEKLAREPDVSQSADGRTRVRADARIAQRVSSHAQRICQNRLIPFVLSKSEASVAAPAIRANVT